MICDKCCYGVRTGAMVFCSEDNGYVDGEPTMCSWFKPIVRPKTNADRIRAMSDEELAEFMDAANACKNFRECDDNWTCDVCWLDWLRLEAET